MRVALYWFLWVQSHSHWLAATAMRVALYWF